MFKINQRVYIIPIDEYGTIASIKYDDAGCPIYYVDLASGFGHHICREFELAAG